MKAARRSAWELDLSWYGHRGWTAPDGQDGADDADPEAEEEVVADPDEAAVRLEGQRLYLVPPAVFDKFRMKRDTGQGLRALWLSNQRIGLLSSQVGALLNLRTLGLANNRLKELPPELGQLKRLQRLVASGNQLTSLPDALCGAQALQELRLDGNCLEAIPDCVFGLVRLVRLSLVGNRVAEVPARLRRLRYLSELELDDNKLTDEVVQAADWASFSQNLQILGLGGDQAVRNLPLGALALRDLRLVRLPRKTYRPHDFAAVDPDRQGGQGTTTAGR